MARTANDHVFCIILLTPSRKFLRLLAGGVVNNREPQSWPHSAFAFRISHLMGDIRFFWVSAWLRHDPHSSTSNIILKFHSNHTKITKDGFKSNWGDKQWPDEWLMRPCAQPNKHYITDQDFPSFVRRWWCRAWIRYFRETIKSRTPLYGEPITPKTNWIITGFSVVGQPVTRTELNL